MDTIYVDSEISLIPVSPADADEFFSIIDNQRDYLGKWLPFVKNTRSCGDTLAFIETVLSNPSLGSEPVFKVRYREETAGIIGLKNSDPINRKTEIGYWLSENLQHRGIITRSVRALCKHVFSEMKYNRIQVKCAVGNTPSSNIPKRLNFVFEGIERAGELMDKDRYADLEVFSLLASEWENPVSSSK